MDYPTQFAEFARHVYAAGLLAVRKTDSHWQILGGVKAVNFYPPYCKRGRSFYVNGALAAVRGKKATVAAAIYAAKDGVIPLKKRAKRRVPSGLKKRLLLRSPYCKWCSTRLTDATATIDHIIPLAQGGSNRRDNLCLACDDCNASRGAFAVRPVGV